MLQPGRHANTGDYRYGFQGQELDNELKGEGNSINYKFRMHDPRVGRFFAVDPLTSKYPHYTPYSFSGNKVIAYRELEGLEETLSTRMQYNDQKEFLKGKITADELKERDKARAIGTIIGIGALIDVYVTRGWITRTMVAYSTGDVMHSAQMQTYYRDQGDEEKAKTYEQEGADATKSLFIEGITYKSFSSLRYIRKISERKELAKLWKIESGYINFERKVFTETLEDGTELIQFRLKGTEGTKGNYYAKPGTRPEEIGLNSEDVAETYRVIVNGNSTKALRSTHIENKAPYYDSDGAKLKGGGEQIFSKDLKNNATFERIDN